MWLRWHSADDDTRRARWVAIGATIVFVVLVCGGEPWRLFARAGFSSDFYESQARAYLHGHLDVPPAAAGLEGLVVDGRTYLYYGPLLSIVRMPFVLFGHWADGRLARVSMTIAFVVALTMAFHLARRVRALLAADAVADTTDAVDGAVAEVDEVDDTDEADDTAPHRRWSGRWQHGSLIVAIAAASPLLYLAGWTSVYHETEMWACALALATMVALVDLWREPSRRHLGIAGAAAIATVMTRSSVGFGALAALAGVGVLLWPRERRLTGSAIAVMAVGLLANSGLNYAKFGEPIDIPADRQVLVLQDPARAEWFAGNDGSFFSTRFLPTTVVQYLRPDAIGFERLVPVVRFGSLATDRGSYPLAGNTPASSLPVAATALTLLAAAGVVVMVRRRSWLLLTLTGGGLVAAVPSFLIGFVANRYLVDMLPALIVPATAALAALAGPRLRSRWVGGFAVAALLWGGWVNASFALWTQNMKEPGFTDVRYRIDDAVFGGAPPSVVDIGAGGAAGRDGVIGIDGDCAGLYIAEQGRWVPLERANGVRRIHGTLTPVAGDVAVATAEGDIVIEPGRDASGGEVLTVTFTPRTTGTAAEPVVGTPTPWDGDPVDVAIVSDPTTGELAVSIGGDDALYTFAAPSLAGATISPSLRIERPDDRATPICDRLAARR